MKNFIKKICSVILLSLSIIVIPGCKKEFHDYIEDVKFSQTGWETSSFMRTGLGVVTLKNSVDGDTAHFFTSNNQIVQGRFNGVDTPESTGSIEEWGKAASNYTKNILENAKTIVLETERDDGASGPEADSTSNRYLVWVWTSERPLEEEDGSQLKLLNLGLVQNGYSPSKGTAGSKYEEYFLNADAQAQKFKMNIWSDEKDPLYYYGEAQVTDMQAVFSDPSKWLDAKVYVEGVVTRKMGYSAYIQDTFEQEDGSIKTYGAYIYAGYVNYPILKKGNRIGVTGIIAQHYGSYQITDVSYNEYFPSNEDMRLISTDHEVEPIELTVKEAQKGEHMGILCSLKNLKVTGGYGGTKETNASGEKNEKNSMTLYVEDSEGNQFNIRIDDSVFIKGLDGSTIKTYRYFEEYCSKGEGYTFDFTGLMGRYESQTNAGHVEIQLMLVSSADLVHNSPETI